MTVRADDLSVGPTIVQVLAGAGTADDEAELQRWLAGDPERIRQLEDWRAVWVAAGTSQQDWDTTLLQRRILRVTDGSKVMAANIASPADSDHSRAVTPRAPNDQGAWRTWLPVAAAAVLLITFGILVGRWGERPRQLAAADHRPMVELVGQPGHQAAFGLADGSWVVLGKHSRLRYPPAFAEGTSRDVYLHGEAYFEVAHDAARPFRVHTGHVITHVLGTRFDVRASAGDDTVQVVVAEGRVGLDDGTAETVLNRGDIGTVQVGENTIVRRQVDVSSYLAWIRQLVIAGMPDGAVAWTLQDTLDWGNGMDVWNRSIAGVMLLFPGPALGAAVASVAVTAPTSASAQAVKPADLVGTWQLTFSPYPDPPGEHTPVINHFLTFTDSTWTVDRFTIDGKDTTSYVDTWFDVGYVKSATGAWTLKSDTLLTLKLKSGSLPSYRVALQGQQLLMERDCGQRLYQRIDPSKPLSPPVPTPAPPTIKPSDLAGRWITTHDGSQQLARLGGANFYTDSLTLKPDSTWTKIRAGVEKRQQQSKLIETPYTVVEKGRWYIRPGDMLQLTDSTGKNTRVWQKLVLQGQQFTLESPYRFAPECGQEIWTR